MGWINRLPKHAAGLIIEHNPHKCVYERVEEYVEPDDWVSDEQRDKAIATDDFWSIQWYPATPVGFYRLAAHDFDVLLAKAEEE